LNGGRVKTFIQEHRTLVLVTGIAAGFLLIVLWLFVQPVTVGHKISFIQTVGGIVGGAALLSGLYFTARTLQVNREGQITERFTQAIDQLGRADEKGKKVLEIRLGGIYALERIARDSERDHWPIMEVLTAYVRQHSQRESIGAPSKEATEKEPGEPSNLKPSDDGVAGLDADIQAIVTVLRRRTRYLGVGEPEPINLRHTHLEGAKLNQAHLEGADLWEAHLEGANLLLAHLKGAILWEAHLEGAILLLAHLEGAKLNQAHLEGAHLNQAHLEGAILWEVHLEGAHLEGAHLEGADLWEAHLEGANLNEARDLTQEQLDAAIGDDETEVPDHLKVPSSWLQRPDV
jgi:hypothetical protein